MRGREFLACAVVLAGAAGLPASELARHQPSEHEWTEYMRTGNAAFDEGRTGEAARYFHAAIGIASQPSQRAAALNNLAALEESRGNLGRAEKLYADCIEAWSNAGNASPDALAKPLNNLAVLYRRKGDYQRASELYERSLALRPNHPTVLNNLGRMHLLRRRFREAEECFLRATAIDARNAAALVNLAELHIATGRTEEAERTATRAADVEAGRPLEIVARLVLASAARERKEWKASDVELSRAVALARSLLGEDHPLTACAYAEQADVARKLNRKREASEYEERARRAIRTSADRHTTSLSELLSEDPK